MLSPSKQTDTLAKITIKDLFHTAASMKVRIVLVISSCMLLAAAYGFFQQKTYEAKTEILPATPADLSAYNATVTLLNKAAAENEKIYLDIKQANKGEISTDDAYHIFLRHVTSNTTQQIFFEQYYLPHFYQNPSVEQKEIIWQQLKKNLHITTQQDDTGNKTIIKLLGNNSEQLSSWVNAYAQLALSESAQQLQNTLQSMLTAQQNILSQELAAAQHSAADERQQYITRLEDALQVAQSIGLNDSHDGGSLIFTNNDENLYLRGTKALESELAVIRARPDNLLYTPELVKLSQRQHILNQTARQNSTITPAVIDIEARPSTKSTNLPLSILLILGAISGILLSLCLVAGITSWRVNQRS